MNTASFKTVQGLLWFICGFHILVGLGLNVSAGFPQVMAEYYGATVVWTSQLGYLVKPLGAFMLVLGLLGVVAARNPLANGAIVYAFVGVFFIRALQRVVFGREIYEAFAIAPGRNLANAAFFLLLGVVLLVLYRHVAKGAGAAG